MHGSSACEQGLPAVDTSNISPEVYPISHVLSASEAEKLLEMLNSEQQIAAKAITIALDSYPHHSTPVKNNANVFFIDGPGGTGKTYFYNYIITVCKARQIKFSSSAWVGIAATLLEGGQTCHSTFKLPVPCLDGAKCNVSPSFLYAEQLQYR